MKIIKTGAGCFALILLLAIFGSMSARNVREQAANNPAPAPKLPAPLNPAAPAEAVTAPRTIPGLAAVDVHGNLTDRGFALKTRYGQVQSEWVCKATQLDCELEADVFGPGPTQITAVRGSVTHVLASDPKPAAKSFLGFLASVPYTGAEPEKAKKWVEDHIAEEASTVIGGVQFEIFGTEFVRMLRIAPALNE